MTHGEILAVEKFADAILERFKLDDNIDPVSRAVSRLVWEVVTTEQRRFQAEWEHEAEKEVACLGKN